jgi:hypothetical protein
MGNEHDSKSIERLEQELAQEHRASSALRASLAQLQAKLKDQQERLNALGAGREETMQALHRARAELDRVAAERDQLQKQLARIDGMQTETIALGEESAEEPAVHEVLPSLEELMASLGSLDEAPVHGGSGSTDGDSARSATPTGSETEPPGEMLAPDLMFPPESDAEASTDAVGRLLVYLDAQPPVKYPLFKDVITIGRSASADIQIEDDFISRVHARLICGELGVVVEDANSKNGIQVNSRRVTRQSLKHGDVIGLGTLRFTFIDIEPPR